MSRPPKEGEDRRSRQVIFRLTAAEHDQLAETAQRAGLSPNELARRQTLRRRVVIQTTAHLDPAFLMRLDRIGHNLNQLVKSAHIFGRVSPLIGPLCHTISALMAQALEDHADGA